MSALSKKLLRDLWQMRWQYLAVGAMIALGVALYCASTMGYRNLDASYESSYELLKFEDLGVTFQPSPQRVVKQLEEIPGVAAVEGRLVKDVMIGLPDRHSRKVVGRMISLPADRVPTVNQLKLTAGREVSGSRREVLLEKSFADANGLAVGDRLSINEGTTSVEFTIAGIVISPEYVYVVRSKQDVMPAKETFGVMFLSEDVLGPLDARSGLINEVRLRLLPDADPAKISREIELRLQAHNPDQPTLREDQPSHQLLQQDVDGFRVYAVLFPLLFFSVSALTVYTLLTRTIHLERGIIGLLRALGYSRGRVVLHFLSVALTVGLIGGTGGAVLGVWMGQALTDWYLTFVSVGTTVYESAYTVGASGLLIAAMVSVAAGFLPALRASKIGPAEAMRNSGARLGKIVALDRLMPRLKLIWRIPLRNIFRQTKRSLSTLFGIVAGIALIMTGQGMLDSTNEIMDSIAGSMFGDDLRLEFLEAQDGDIVDRIRSWDGVGWAEGALDVPVEFSKGDVVYSALLMGVDPNGRMMDVRTLEGDRITPTGEGVILGRTLRKRLNVEVGDLVSVSIPSQFVDEAPAKQLVRVEGFTSEPIGTVAYTTRTHVWNLFRRDLSLVNHPVTSVRLDVEPQFKREVKQRLLTIPEAAAVSSSTEVREMLEDMMGQFERFIQVMLIFGAALAFSIVFNTVTINVIERVNEVATMRTLGVARWQVAAMITIENLALGLIGVLIGLPIGRKFVEYFFLAAQTEEQADLFTFEITIYPQTYVVTALTILAVMLLSQLPSLVYLNRLDLAKTTKTRV
jgi:putative ABC transport system permease protein